MTIALEQLDPLVPQESRYFVQRAVSPFDEDSWITLFQHRAFVGELGREEAYGMAKDYAKANPYGVRILEMRVSSDIVAGFYGGSGYPMRKNVIDRRWNKNNGQSI